MTYVERLMAINIRFTAIITWDGYITSDAYRIYGEENMSLDTRVACVVDPRD